MNLLALVATVSNHDLEFAALVLLCIALLIWIVKH